MNPFEYEHLVATVLRNEGWSTTVSPPTGDHGIDVVAVRDGVRMGVQAKMYGPTGRPINGELVMNAYGAAHYADCTEVMIATDARVLDSAVHVATKLGVAIRHLPAVWPSTQVVPSPVREVAEGALDFGVIWDRHIGPLQGQTLRAGNRSNVIVSVDGGGVLRRTSRGNTQRISIEIFRWAIERLLAGETVTRADVNAEYIGRASSGVMLILASVPLFEPVGSDRVTALRLCRAEDRQPRG